MEAVASHRTIRYLRIPHWVQLEHRSFQPRDPFFDVRLKAKEHRAREKRLSIRGIIFDTDANVPFQTCVAVRVSLSEEEIPYEFDCRIINSHKVGDDHQYRVTAEFIARTDAEIYKIVSFVKKYY